MKQKMTAKRTPTEMAEFFRGMGRVRSKKLFGELLDREVGAEPREKSRYYGADHEEGKIGKHAGNGGHKIGDKELRGVMRHGAEDAGDGKVVSCQQGIYAPGDQKTKKPAAEAVEKA